MLPIFPGPFFFEIMKAFVRIFPGLILVLVLSACPQLPAAEALPLRVACVGDSITAGLSTPHPSWDSYPAQLQRLLGEKGVVGNFGFSGATLLKQGDKPYQRTASFQQALQFKPDIVVIMLGTNDTKPQNWKLKAQFTADYKDLIGQFRALDSKPRLVVCLPPYVAGAGKFGITEPVLLEQMPFIERVAADEKVGLVDVHSAFKGRDALLPDCVHPNAEGAGLLAKVIYQGITGKPFEGEVPAVMHSTWKGYERIDFLVNNRVSILVTPKTALPGRPWIWRSEAFGIFPAVDLALLEKGYHVACTDVQNLYGAPVALDAMDKFYDHVTKTFGLSARTVPEGFSVGGLSALNWAARNPGKVACLYVDAPVCDFKSWPGGKGKSKGSPADWERCKRAYGLTEEQALTYASNPIDNLKPVAAAKIPIIAVAGDADDVVPMDENIRKVETRYRELGGEIRLITKPGVGRRPLSLADPTPVVEFILKHP